MKTLLFGTMYLSTQYLTDCAKLWLKMVNTKYPDCAWLLVDSNSPQQFFSQLGIARLPINAANSNRINCCLTFPDNIGHLSVHRRDGWGRAFCYGIEHGLSNMFDYVFHCESDMLTRFNLDKVVSNMELHHKGCASPNVSLINEPMIETGLMVMSTDWLRRSKLVEKYDWKNSVYPDPDSKVHIPKPEQRIMQIVGKDWQRLLIPGGRNEHGDVVQKCKSVAELGYITHAPIETMVQFSELP